MSGPQRSDHLLNGYENDQRHLVACALLIECAATGDRSSFGLSAAPKMAHPCADLIGEEVPDIDLSPFT